MRIRPLLLASACLATTLVGEVRAAGSISDDNHDLIEERIAISIGPSRTTVWTQLRLAAAAGPVAMIVPVRPGASLDWASDAWLEALDASTAPRLLPPTGALASCPDEPPPTDPVHVAGDLSHRPTMTAAETPQVLDSAAAVQTWAEQNGMFVNSAMLSALTALTDHRFVVARFTAPNGEVLTPTLRVTGPDVAPSVPLWLTQAGDQPVRVTTWILGNGRAAIENGPGITLSAITFSYNVASGETDYPAQSLAALAAAGPTAWLLESASQQVLTMPLEVWGEHRVNALMAEYVTRAASYAADFDESACLTRLGGSLSSSATVAPSCARAELGVVEGMATCTESATADEIDPADLRCGNAADDFAVALSELSPAQVWLSRVTLRIAPQTTGTSRPTSLSIGPPLDPIATASNVDSSNCNDVGAGGSGANTSGSGGSGAAGWLPVTVPVYPVDTSCGATEVGAVHDYVTVLVSESEDAPDAIYFEEVACGGDSSDSYAVSFDDDTIESGGDDDGCSGDTSSSYETWETFETTTSYESSTDTDREAPAGESSDNCGGDTSTSYDTDEVDDDSSSNACGGDTTTSYETTETYDDTEEDTAPSGDCGGDSVDSYETTVASAGDGTTTDDSDTDDSDTDDSDTDGSETDDGEVPSDGCSGDLAKRAARQTSPPRARRKKRRAPIRFSKVTLGFAFLLFPLRRLSRRRQNPHRQRPRR